MFLHLISVPKSFLATMMVELPHLGEDVRKRGPAEYADFAKSVPQENPFTPASAHAGGTSQTNISQYNNGCSGSMQSNHYNFYFDTALSTNRVVLWAAVATAAAALGALMLVRTFKR